MLKRGLHRANAFFRARKGQRVLLTIALFNVVAGFVIIRYLLPRPGVLPLWFSAAVAVFGVGSGIFSLVKIIRLLNGYAGARRDSVSGSSNVSPPAIAELLLYLVTSSRRREAVIGDKAEKFELAVAAFGRRRAVRFYWIDTLQSAWPLLKRSIARLGIVSAIVAAARSYWR